MENIKLSYIVPVYRVEKYLRKCVDSLLAQDYEGYEIILVDDGSPDGCPQMCDNYAVAHDNIRVVHQDNAGLSAARNAGLKVAKGEYVCFVDSDDYWEDNVLGGLMAQVEREQLDVLRFGYQNVNEQNEVFEPNKTPRYIDIRTEIVDGETYLNTRTGYACYAVMYIIRKAIVPTFTVGIHFEDVDWLPRMLLKIQRVNSTTTIVYNYLVRQGSITNSQGDKDKLRKNIEDQITVMQNLSLLMKQNPACSWLRNMRDNMASGALVSIAQDFYQDRIEYIHRVKDMAIFPLSLADQGRTYIRRAKMINCLGPKIFCMIMHWR